LSSLAPLCVDKCRALTLTGPLSDGAGCAVLCHAALYRAAGPDPCGAGHSLHEAPGPCTSGAGACWLHFHLGRALAPAHSLHEAPGPLGRAASGARLCTLALGLSLRRRQIAICGASRCMGSGSPGPCTSGAGACWLHFRLGPYLGAGGVFVASLRRPAFFFLSSLCCTLSTALAHRTEPHLGTDGAFVGVRLASTFSLPLAPLYWPASPRPAAHGGATAAYILHLAALLRVAGRRLPEPRTPSLAACRPRHRPLPHS